jgi:TRAP-type uncharacterized transport system substrate-binding protein
MKPCSPTRWVMLMVFSSLLFVSQLRAEGIGMVTGTATETYIQFGQDIAKMAQSAGLDILHFEDLHGWRMAVGSQASRN